MLKRPHYIALGLVVLFALVIMNLPDRTATRLKLSLGGLFLPLFGLASSSHQLAGQAGQVLTPRSELIKQNEELRRENEQLRVQSIRAEEALRENTRLRQLYGWQQRQHWKLKLASVVLREPASWWRTVQIDLGSRNGLSNNLPVLAPDGALVGRISSVSLTRAQVLLLGDPGLKVSARVENETHDTGIIGSSGPLQSELVDLGFLSKGANLKPGQNVVTSGNGGIFPPGIPIGKVVDVHPVDYGLRTEARVKLSANLDALEEVWVLFP